MKRICVGILAMFLVVSTVGCSATDITEPAACTVYPTMGSGC